jgi:hypothetical protein
MLKFILISGLIASATAGNFLKSDMFCSNNNSYYITAPQIAGAGGYASAGTGFPFFPPLRNPFSPTYHQEVSQDIGRYY